MLGIARIDEVNFKTTGVEELEDRNPIDAGRLHDDRLDAAFRKPVHQPMQIRREGAEIAHRLGCPICAHRSRVHGRPDIDRRRIRMHHRYRTGIFVSRFITSHRQSSCLRWKGWAALLINFLIGIA